MSSVTVAIPSYNRPDFLIRAIRSIRLQILIPNELVVILRESDFLSVQVVKAQELECTAFPIRLVTVTEPGFLPPIYKAAESATSTIIAIMDDDAEAHPNWLERLVRCYEAPGVVAAGGRCVNYFLGVEKIYPTASKVGKLTWYGKPIGNMYRDTTFSEPCYVDFMMGGNMSIRTEVFSKVLPDRLINQNVAFHWEVDVGLQIKKLGHKILYDPQARVDHHSAPREIDGMRSNNATAIFWSNFNYTYIMKKYLPLPRLVSYFLYSAILGWNDSPGIIVFFLSLLRFKPLSWTTQLRPSIFGRWRGIIEPVRRTVND